jgi:DNA-binding FrmR family transcriptional regulator
MVQSTKKTARAKPQDAAVIAALPRSAEEQLAYRSEYQKDVTHRLRRIQGQVGAILEMIESDRSCEDIAQQMSAVRKAMDKAFYRMMTCSVMEAAGVCEVDRLKELERSTRILERYA